MKLINRFKTDRKLAGGDTVVVVFNIEEVDVVVSRCK